MIARLKAAALAVLKALDILLCTLWLAPLYVFGLADKPSGRQMISSYVGKAEVNGHKWATIAGFLIDAGACLLGDKPGHCERAYLHYKALDQ